MTKITIDRATVEQALDAVEALEGLSNWEERILGRVCDSLRQALQQPNEFHPDWDQIKPFNDRIAELERVAKQALEAIEEFVSNELTFGQRYTNEGQCLLDSIAALRQALEQDVSLINEGNKEAQQQEPVAWMYVNDDDECEQIEYGEPFDDPAVTPLYTHPPIIDKSAAIRIATALGWEPKKEWVGLTDEEREFIYHNREPYADLKAVEALLKEKNNG